MNQVVLSTFVLGLFLLQSCVKRADSIFSAFDELHYIILYEDGNEFELLYNGVNKAIGTYALKGDTILLSYSPKQFKEFDPNEKLTRKILIDKAAQSVKSIDNKMPFCAVIEVDQRPIK